MSGGVCRGRGLTTERVGVASPNMHVWGVGRLVCRVHSGRRFGRACQAGGVQQGACGKAGGSRDAAFPPEERSERGEDWWRERKRVHGAATGLR